MRYLARLGRSTAFLGVLPLALSCASTGPSESLLPPAAVALEPPAIYAEWHARTQACSGLSGDLGRVEFYVVPGVDAFPTKEGAKVGLWTREGNSTRIVIAGNFVDHEMVVRHEMLHDLLGREGHPAEFFVSKCQLTWDSWHAAGGD